MLHLVLLFASQAHDLPKWSYHSTIPAEQRVKAIAKIADELHKLGAKNKKALEAESILRREAAICEPLGEDSSGSNAFRFIAVAKVKQKDWFGVMPIFAKDAKASRLIREFIEAKPTAYAGMDPDAPIIYLRVDGPDSNRRLLSYLGAIKTRGHRP